MSFDHNLARYRHDRKNAVIELQIVTAQNENGKLDDEEFLEKVTDISQRILAETKSINAPSSE